MIAIVNATTRKKMSEKCIWCDKPLATDHDYNTIAEGEGTHLCWSEWEGGCFKEDDAYNIIKNLRKENEQLRKELANANE